MNPIIEKDGERHLLLRAEDLPGGAKVAILEEGIRSIAVVKGVHYHAEDINGLLELPHFKELSLGGEAMDISVVTQLHFLEKLSIGDDVVRIGCDVSGLTKLRELDITISKHQSLPSAELPKLTKLRMWNFREKNLKQLKFMPALQELLLHEARNLESLGGIEHCKQLKRIDIAFCPKLLSIEALSKLNHLEYLEFESAKKIKDLTPVFDISSLITLIAINLSTVDSILGIKNLKNLKHLTWRGIEILDGNLTPLLESLGLKHGYVTPNKKYYQPSAVKVYEAIKARSLSATTTV
ncbi:MAG: leucine-rich repeat domain-containing protein [Brachymonas sp.]|nr:leucine-rich repeat domain-containing protein [Brachymonas sp.]